MHNIISSANSDHFTSFQLWITFISSFALIAMVRTSKTMLNYSGKNGHPCFVLIIMEMLSVFHHWECFLYVCCIWSLLCWGRFPLFSFSRQFFFFFIINGYWNLSKPFPASIEIIIWFLYFHLLIWCNIVGFVFVESSRPWDKSHLIMVFDPFNVLFYSVC